MRQGNLHSAHESCMARTNRAVPPGRPHGSKKRGSGPKPAPSSDSCLRLASSQLKHAGDQAIRRFRASFLRRAIQPAKPTLASVIAHVEGSGTITSAPVEGVKTR